MAHIVQDNYVTFRAGDDLVCLPISVFDEKESKLLAWLKRTDTKPVRPADNSDAVARLMWDTYRRVAFPKPILEYIPWMTPRRITKFQYWLRHNLLRWGLI